MVKLAERGLQMRVHHRAICCFAGPLTVQGSLLVDHSGTLDELGMVSQKGSSTALMAIPGGVQEPGAGRQGAHTALREGSLTQDLPLLFPASRVGAA